MYPQHTNLSHPTSNPPKTTPNSQSTSTNKSTESSPQSSLPCGQRTPAASTSSSDAPTPQTPPQMFANTSHQPKIPTHTQHTSSSPHRQHMKTPLKTNIDQSSQSSIVGEDQQRVPKSADGTQVKCSKPQPRQPDERLCFYCNLPGHFKRNCPKIPYCSKCRMKGHTQDRCTNKSQRTRHVHQAGKPRNQQKSFQAITISVCSVQEIIKPPTVHDNDNHHLLILLLVVQVLPLTKMHLAPHAPLFILIRNHHPHIVNLHCMYKHQLST